jgi:hypothetical protein
MKLSAVQEAILLSRAQGDTLKSHRYLDGVKVYQLHRLDGSIAAVHRSTVEALSKRGLIGSNYKFPAATYWLTEQGQAAIAELAQGDRA